MHARLLGRSEYFKKFSKTKVLGLADFLSLFGICDVINVIGIELSNSFIFAITAFAIGLCNGYDFDDIISISSRYRIS